MQRFKVRFDFVVVAACLMTLATFAWHGFAGDRSVHYLKALKEKNDVLEGKLAGLTKEKGAMEKKLNLLRPESVDPDLVEELVRAHLGLVKPGDLLIVTGSVDRKPQ
jgi:cell division protein FtsB